MDNLEWLFGDDNKKSEVRTTEEWAIKKYGSVADAEWDMNRDEE